MAGRHLDPPDLNPGLIIILGRRRGDDWLSCRCGAWNCVGIDTGLPQPPLLAIPFNLLQNPLTSDRVLVFLPPTGLGVPPYFIVLRENGLVFEQYISPIESVHSAVVNVVAHQLARHGHSAELTLNFWRSSTISLPWVRRERSCSRASCFSFSSLIRLFSLIFASNAASCAFWNRKRVNGCFTEECRT